MVRKAKSDSLSKKAYKFRIYPSEEQKIFFAKKGIKNGKKS